MDALAYPRLFLLAGVFQQLGWVCGLASCFLLWMVQSMVLLPSGGSLCLERWMDQQLRTLLLPRHMSVNIAQQRIL